MAADEVGDVVGGEVVGGAVDGAVAAVAGVGLKAGGGGGESGEEGECEERQEGGLVHGCWFEGFWWVIAGLKDCFGGCLVEFEVFDEI